MTRITNVEYMVNLLSDFMEDKDIEFHKVNIDDGWASSEAMIYYNIACPYYVGDPRCECKNNKLDDPIDSDQCVDCKAKWLASEVDE